MTDSERQPVTPCERFGQYALRPITEQDRVPLQCWIDADPDHAGRVDADFFLGQVPGEDAWVLERAGRVVLYFKTQVVCRAHVQFGPSETDCDRAVNRDAMTFGLEWLEERLAANHFRELIFSSTSAPLIAASIRRQGFRRSPHELVRTLPAFGMPRPHLEARLPESQLSEGRVG